MTTVRSSQDEEFIDDAINFTLKQVDKMEVEAPTKKLEISIPRQVNFKFLLPFDVELVRNTIIIKTTDESTELQNGDELISVKTMQNATDSISLYLLQFKKFFSNGVASH